jgi:glutathione gamma-glutamylcysteinyltransferase
MYRNISMYKKELPKFLIPFTSARGKILFREALNEGNMENFFELSEQYVTQSRPEDCAVSSLVMVLNSLGIDPGKQWKGPWRWFSEDLLNCVNASESGLSLHQFLQLAHCNKAWSIGFYTNSQDVPEKDNILCGEHKNKILYRSVSVETFRTAIIAACRQSKFYLVINCSRQALGQSGEGHYSPIAGYHSGSDMCLILDVARFKYPAYWCPVDLMYEALERKDPVSQKSRGFVCVSRSIKHFSEICARPMDIVSLSKVHSPLTINDLKFGCPEILPLVFRLFFDLYEKFENYESILNEIERYPETEIHQSFEKIISELNPDLPKAYKLLVGAFSNDPGEVSSDFKRMLGIL